MTPTQYRASREKLGLTQAQLAERLGVTRRTVINREAGRLITAEAELAISALSNQPQRKPPWRELAKNELPIAGDEAWNADLDRWEAVSIPSMWLAGGKRIEGDRLRTRRNTARPPLL